MRTKESRKIQSSALSLHDWYSCSKINALLKHYLSNAPKAHIFTAVSGTTTEAGNILAEQLQQFYDHDFIISLESKYIVIPTNLNNSHWVLIIIHHKKNEDTIVHYLDPLASPMPEQLRKIFQKEFNIKSINEQYSSALQSDGYSCGAWVVEIARKIFHGDGVLDKNYPIYQSIEEHNLIYPEMPQNFMSSSIDTSSKINTLTPKNNTDYFMLDPIGKGSYVIGCPAVKSSGDIYHILAYLVVAKRLGFKPPTVVLAYDIEETKKQATRSLGIAETLDFKNVQLKKIETTGYQPNARMNKLREDVASTKKTSHLIDQKQTTALFSRMVNQFGREKTTTLFKSSFLEYTAAAREKFYLEMNEIENWTQNEFKRIAKSAKNKKIVLINHRIAAGANADQNIGTQALGMMENILEDNGIFYWYLCTNPNEEKNATIIFDHTKENWDKNGLNKLRHILLLIHLSQLPNLVGMVGNTSGTLDIAAFLGIEVFCIHDFTNTSNRNYFDAQDYRMLLQHWFMTIGIPITQQGDGVQDVGGVHFKKWLLQKEPIASLPSNLDRSTGIISKKTPYAEHADRLPFSGSLTWSYDLSQDKLSKWKKLKNKSEPYFVPNTWFTELDKLLDKDLENAKKKIAKRN